LLKIGMKVALCKERQKGTGGDLAIFEDSGRSGIGTHRQFLGDTVRRSFEVPSVYLILAGS
jgi:hypothetical protein